MSSGDRWSFRPDEEARKHISVIEEEVEQVDTRTDAINFCIRFQRELVETGGLDLIFKIMSAENLNVTEEREEEVYKRAVKEAIAEMQENGDL